MDYVLLTDAARELNLSRAYVWKLIQAGLIEASRLGGVYWVIDRAELDRFKAAKRRRPGRPRTQGTNTKT